MTDIKIKKWNSEIIENLMGFDKTSILFYKSELFFLQFC